MSRQCHYRPQRSWGKVMFLQVCVILFTGGEYLTRYPPRTRYTPRTRYPLDQVPPLGPGTPPRTSPRTRYTPRDQVHPPGPGTPRQDQVHPPAHVHHPPGPGTPPRTRYPPETRYTLPPGPGTPSWDQVPPPDQGDTVYMRAVRILLECILVLYMFTIF